jgi:hypothetical protein
MKIRIILFLAVSAVVTLSFTFSSIHHTTKKSNASQHGKTNSTEPIGGFVAEEKI